MQKLCLGSFLWFVVFVPAVCLAKESPSHPVVFSDDTGKYYVRSIPESKWTYTDGVTKVYRSDTDELLCEYPWYCRYRLWLYSDGTNVTLIRHNIKHDGIDYAKDIVVGFYLNGKVIKEHTVAEILQGKEKIVHRSSEGYIISRRWSRGVVREGEEKAKYFEITTIGGRTLRFNLDDGQLVSDDPAP